MERILDVVVDATGEDRNAWRPGRRSDSTGRAVAAFLARRQLGYSATEVATALRYKSHSSVRRDVERIKPPTPQLARTIPTH